MKTEDRKKLAQEILDKIVNKTMQLETLIDDEYNYLNRISVLVEEESNLMSAKARMLELHIKILDTLQKVYKDLKEGIQEEDETEKILMEIINQSEANL